MSMRMCVRPIPCPMPLTCEEAHSQHEHSSIHVAVEGKPQVEALAIVQGAVELVHAVVGHTHKVEVMVVGVDHIEALQRLSNQADQSTRGIGLVLLELGGSGQVEPEHHQGDDEQRTAKGGEQGDGDRHSDDRGDHDETIDAQVVQGIDQVLIQHVLVLGEGNKQLAHRVLEEEAERGVQDTAEGGGFRSGSGE